MVRRELARHDRPENKIDAQRFHKEKLAERFVLKTPVLRKISNDIYRCEIRNRSKKEILSICDDLLAAGGGPERFMAFDWAGKLHRRYTSADFSRFELWLKKYVTNWGACDHLCGSVIGILLRKYPRLAPRVKKWTGSGNMWLRRAAAVSLIPAVRKGTGLADVLATAEKLLTDKEDLVQKGYGWMLKEASREFPREVFEFVLLNRRTMPRTALRYAIEKYPAAKRRQAMKKDW